MIPLKTWPVFCRKKPLDFYQKNSFIINFPRRFLRCSSQYNPDPCGDLWPSSCRLSVLGFFPFFLF